MDTNGNIIKEKRRNNEKRKEKSRDAARCRRSKESEIFSDLARVLPLPSSIVTHLDKASVMRLVIANLRIMHMLKSSRINNENLKPDISDQLYLQSTGGVVLVISLDGDIIYISNNVSTYLGTSQIDLLGQSFFDIVHPCDHQEIRDLLSRKIKTKGQVSSFARVKCSQNSKGRTINLKTASYKVLHLVGRFLQIDETSKDKYGFVSIATPIPYPLDVDTPLGSYTFLSKHSLDMKFIYADERMKDFLGYNPEDLIGESMYNFHHVEDNKEIMKSFKILFEKGQSETCHYRFMAQGGGYIWVCTQASVIFCEKKNIPLSVVCVHYVISGKYNEVEICSREQLEWIKVKDNVPKDDIPTSSSIVAKSTVVTHVTPKMKTIVKNCTKSDSPYLSKKIVPTSVPLHLLTSETENAGQSPRPRPATSEIFAPRTPDMNKGFLMFSDDESGFTMLKEEPEDLTHLAPTAGDVCVPLAIPPLMDIMSGILPDDYTPLINEEKENPLFSSYSNDNSRSLSPVLTQSSSGYSSATLCGLSDDGTTAIEDANMKSLLGLDLVEAEHDTERTGYMDVTGPNGLPLLTTSDLLWDDCPPASPSQAYSLEIEDLKPDNLTDFSSLASLLQIDDDVLKKSSEDVERIFVTEKHEVHLDSEKRKRNSTVQEEIVKKRKHGPLNTETTASVLMNLLTDGRGIGTRYTCFESRAVSGHSITQSCVPSIDP